MKVDIIALLLTAFAGPIFGIISITVGFHGARFILLLAPDPDILLMPLAGGKQVSVR